MAAPVDDVADEDFSGANLDHGDSVAPAHVPPSDVGHRSFRKTGACATVAAEGEIVPEQETFDEFIDAVTGGSWADPTVLIAEWPTRCAG